MLETLFNSKTRTSILGLFFKYEAQKFYVQEVAKITGCDSANVYRELLNLEKAGILTSTRKANQKYFCLVKDSPFFGGLKLLFHEYAASISGEWFLMEEMPEYHPQVVATGMNVAFANEYFKKKALKSRFTKLLSVFENDSCALWLPKQEFSNLAKEIVDRITKNPVWATECIEEIKTIQRAEKEKIGNFAKINFLELSDSDLLSLYIEFYQSYQRLHVPHWLHTALDFGDNLFTNYLIDYTKNQVEMFGEGKYSVGDVFSTLTTPVGGGNITREHQNLLWIIKEINTDENLKNYFKNTETRIISRELRNINSLIEDKIIRHTDEYSWIGYGLVGPGWNTEYFIDIISSLIRQGIDPDAALLAADDDRKKLVRKQEIIIHELKINSQFAKLFEIAREMILTKALRKDTMFYFCSVIENFYREIGRRKYLSLKQIRYLYPHEIEGLLRGEKYSSQKLTDRARLSLYYSTGTYQSSNILEGEKAAKFINKLNLRKEQAENLKILIGTTACPGRVRGEVSVINSAKDIEKMREGNVLISASTNPDLIQAIKKASAIVTDTGGMICHAAIIARELNIPCVVGTKVATKALGDGDVVDVDASHGKVVVIKKSRSSK